MNAIIKLRGSTAAYIVSAIGTKFASCYKNMQHTANTAAYGAHCGVQSQEYEDV